jgi:hypothetical protein
MNKTKQNKKQINGTESKKILVVLCLHVLSNGALRYTVKKTSHCPLPCPASPSPSPSPPNFVGGTGVFSALSTLRLCVCVSSRYLTLKAAFVVAIFLKCYSNIPQVMLIFWSVFRSIPQVMLCFRSVVSSNKWCFIAEVLLQCSSSMLHCQSVFATLPLNVALKVIFYCRIVIAPFTLKCSIVEVLLQHSVSDVVLSKCCFHHCSSGVMMLVTFRNSLSIDVVLLLRYSPSFFLCF